MKNQKISYVLVGLVFIFLSGTGMAQSLEETLSRVKSETGITWRDSHLRVKEHQSIEFKDDTMIITRKSVFDDGNEVTQTASIPIAKIDPRRAKSYPNTDIDGMFYLDILTKNNEKAIEVTTDYGKDNKKNTTKVYFYAIHSPDKKRSDKLKDKIEHLIYLIGD